MADQSAGPPASSAGSAHRMIEALKLAADTPTLLGGDVTRSALQDLLHALERPSTRPPFPTMLRKMWSGTEVQDWIDRHWPRVWIDEAS